LVFSSKLAILVKKFVNFLVYVLEIEFFGLLIFTFGEPRHKPQRIQIFEIGKSLKNETPVKYPENIL
jgi:hypothetical protein